MLSVEDILADSLGLTIRDWFEPTLAHDFLHIVNIPGARKIIPHRWVDDVEIDDLLIGLDSDLPGPGSSQPNWSQDDGAKRLRSALERLSIKDIAAAQIDKMSSTDLLREKSRVKQELKRYDTDFQKQFSRLPNHVEKEPMRPLYVFYKKLKTVMTQMEQNKHDGEGRHSMKSSLETIPEQDEPLTAQSRTIQKKVPSVHDQIASLESRIESLFGEKALVRSKLQSFQEKFVSENNRKIRFHKDLLPIEREYRMYKNLKEDIVKAETKLRELRGH